MATGPFLTDRAEAARLELASGELPPPVFETGSSSSRLTSVCSLLLDRSSEAEVRSDSSKAVAAGIEPAKGRLTVARPYQHGNTTRVSAAGFEPAFSCSQSTRTSHFSHTPAERPAGVEPALPPWQGSRLPLHHGHTTNTTGLSNSKWDPRGSNPHLPG